ncbi:MAG TPA: hypothetical protein VI112_08555 [Bacteroidia bacterium]|jgi:hypothetical protein
MKKIRTFLALALLAVPVLHFACKKETTCYANITVLDVNGAPVVGATVKLDCSTCGNNNSTLQIDQSTTDASGRASFTFKYEAVLDIHVNGGSPVGVVKLEAGKTAEKTVTY